MDWSCVLGKQISKHSNSLAEEDEMRRVSINLAVKPRPGRNVFFASF